MDGRGAGAVAARDGAEALAVVHWALLGAMVMMIVLHRWNPLGWSAGLLIPIGAITAIRELVRRPETAIFPGLR